MIRRSSALAFCGWSQRLSIEDTSESAAQTKGTAFGALARFHYTRHHVAAKDADLAMSKLNADDTREVQGWLDKLMSSGWAPPEHAEWETPLLVGPDGRLVKSEGEAIYTGHPDVWWASADVLDLYDFKSGKHKLGHPAESLQLASYLVPLAKMTGAKRARIGFYWARTGEWQRCTLDEEGIAQAWERAKYAAGLPEVPRVSEDCRKCWHFKFKRCRAPLDIQEAA